MESQSQPTYSRPVLAAISISIAMLVSLVWLAAIGGVYFGAVARSTSGMVVLGTIPVALLGSMASVLGLMFRGENRHVVQYGLWINGLLAFFAFPAMVMVAVGA